MEPKKGEVEKLSRGLEKAWIVGIGIWRVNGNATQQDDLLFPF
jgi:hypothetical protein